MTRMEDLTAALEEMLAASPGAVSIAAGIALLRQRGAIQSDVDLQNLVGSFAAERRRPIRFDRQP
ncbi:MAG: hypothetical protein E5V63_09335 [Mesorhizobium sp.]|nr:MAG: hypothetical protein E5V63_09335 [Mesorhizobium sp.]